MLALTLLAWRHELSLDRAAVNTTVSIRRAQLAMRFERIMMNPSRPLQVLALDVQQHDDPPDLSKSAMSTIRMLPDCRRLSWLDANGRCIFSISGNTRLNPPDAGLAAVPDWNNIWTAARSAIATDTLAPPVMVTHTFTDKSQTMVDIVVPATLGRDKANVFAGAVIGQFSLDEIAGGFFDSGTLAQFDVRITDGTKTLWQSPPASHWNNSDDSWTMHIRNAIWNLHTQPTPAYLAASASRAPNWILLSGLCASLLVSGLVLQARQYNRRDLLQARAYADALERLHSIPAAVSARLGSGHDVLYELALAAHELIGMSKVSIAVCEPCETTENAEMCFRFVASFGWPPELIGHRMPLSELQTARLAIEENRMIVVGDTANSNLPSQLLRNQNQRSVIQIPLLIQGSVIGLMSLTDEHPHVFTDADVRLARLWGAQAAVILANSQLHEREQSALKMQEQLMDQREKLSTVTASIYAQPTLDGTLGKIVELTPPVLGVDVCIVFLADENGKDLTAVAATPPCGPMIGEKVPMSYEGFARAFATRQVRIAPNASIETIRNPTWDKVPQLGSFISVPMFHGEGQPLGALILVRSAVGDFTRQQIEQAQLFAARAASAIENANLHQQTQRDAQTKAMLLKELNHRVKNNLAGIAGLLAAQENKVPRTARVALARLSRQVRVMAAAHELFAGGAPEVGLEELVGQVAASVVASRPPGAEIRTNLDGVHTRLATDRAVSLAMVLHELMYNGFVHGLGEQGVLEVNARHLDGRRLSIEISDTGIPGGTFEPPTGLGMGLELVSGLVGRELRGVFHLDPIPAGGTRAVVEFPLTEQEAQ